MTKARLVPYTGYSVYPEGEMAPRAAAFAAIEITLHTPDAIRALAELDGGVVGAGTVIAAPPAHVAIGAGARFSVSPGLSDSVAAVCANAFVPYLPGAATASEIMRAFDLDLRTLNFLPAEPAGGIAALKAFSGPFLSVRFCLRSWLGSDNSRDYLARPNVAAVGGSWVAPPHLIAARAWPDITELAAATVARAKPPISGEQL